MTTRTAFFCMLAVLVLCASSFGKIDELRSVVSRKFPQTEGLELACWVVPEEGEGYLSQIIVFQVGDDGRARVLWQSGLDPAYSPEIRFVEEIMVSGLPIALVERQNGAATSQLEHLDRSKLPFIIAHTDGNILDVPVIYRWSGSHFVDDSASHPAYYRQLLSKYKAKLPPDSGGIVSVNLSRIALLSGNRPEAGTILDDALSRERSKGERANKETLKRITEALQGLVAKPRQY